MVILITDLERNFQPESGHLIGRRLFFSSLISQHIVEAIFEYGILFNCILNFLTFFINRGFYDANLKTFLRTENRRLIFLLYKFK